MSDGLATLTLTATDPDSLSVTESTDLAVNDVLFCSIFGVDFDVDIGSVDDLAITVATYDGNSNGTLAGGQHLL